MSVIAKLIVRGNHDYGMGRLIELGCVCENDLMAAYATSDEDKLFTKYSPWGEMKLSQPAGFNLADPPDEFGAKAFYVMALAWEEHELAEEKDRYHPDGNFPGSAAWCVGVCYGVLDLGGTKRVEFQASNGGEVKGHAIERLNWKMSVDNPGASDQFKPGTRYWFVLYPADRFTTQSAIRAAHGHPEPAPAEAS